MLWWKVDKKSCYTKTNSRKKPDELTKNHMNLAEIYLCNTLIPTSDDFTAANDKFEWFATGSWWIENFAIVQCTSVMYYDSLASFWETASWKRQKKNNNIHINDTIIKTSTKLIWSLINLIHHNIWFIFIDCWN